MKEFKTQEQFTKEINSLILDGKNKVHQLKTFQINGILLGICIITE